MNLKKITKTLGIDEKRASIVNSPFSWSVKSEDTKELATWAHRVGLDQAITDQLGQPVFTPDVPIYTACHVAMRRLDKRHWVLIVVGYWSDDVGGCDRGVLAICMDGDEERFGDSLLQQVSKENERDIALWELKHGASLQRFNVQEAEYSGRWMGATDGVDIS